MRGLSTSPPARGLVRDHRAGLGMPRRTKAMTVATIALAGALGAVATRGVPAVAVAVVAACMVGIAVVVWRVPTRETVLARRGRSAATADLDGPRR